MVTNMKHITATVKQDKYYEGKKKTDILFNMYISPCDRRVGVFPVER